MTNVLIAAGWPYANGFLHLGHIAGILGADILARFQRQKNNKVLFVSGSDCHGTPIVVAADEKGVEPQVIAEHCHEQFKRDLIEGLGFSYDLFSKTTSSTHKQVAQDVFLKLYEAGYLALKSEHYPFCPDCNRFLPDRFVTGICPNCGSVQARGDQCDDCGEIFSVSEILSPTCVTCGATPIWEDSEHFYLRLSALEPLLKDWFQHQTGWRQNAASLTKGLLEKGLCDRPITRDLRWGIPVPLPGYEHKCLYVWFEAVCGYLSASIEYASNTINPELWKDFWQDSKAIHYYVHGKDNIAFHSVIWPAILLGVENLHLPDRIISSEYLTLQTRKFSKSRHWAVWIPEFLSKYDGDLLRFYLTLAGPEKADADFAWKTFQTLINNELIGNYGNLVHRVVSQVFKNFPRGIQTPETPNAAQAKLWDRVKDAFDLVGSDLEQAKFRSALLRVLDLTREANRFLSEASPWTTIVVNRQQAEADLAAVLHVIRCLGTLTFPFIPRASQTLAQILGVTGEKWEYPEPKFLTVAVPKPLFRKIEDFEITAELAKLENG
ncbi:MAG: methionine--tRNA ligase [Deltaproteobacteria bacterium]|nr:methionine--tRNA ligase [Deltaproteobacteria bacterium]